MKTFELLKKLFLPLAIAVLTLLGSCQREPETTGNPYMTVSVNDILVSKLGLDYQGVIPSFDIEANVYWTLDMETVPAIDAGTGEEPWIVLPAIGGSGSTTIELTILPNDISDSRTAIITISTLSGLTETITVIQTTNTEEVYFYTDDFGTAANQVPVEEFDGWNYTGIGVDSSKGGIPFTYSGTAVVNSANPSDYEGASGGNNILLTGNGAEFVLKNIRPVGQKYLDISFASSTTAATFDASELILEISSDGKNWYSIPYERATNAAAWEYTTFSMTLAEAYPYVFLRFRTTDGEYMIDDITISYGEGSEENIYELVVIPFKGTSFPVSWIMTAAEWNSGNGIWFSTFSAANNSYYIKSNQNGNEESAMGPATISYVATENRPSTGTAFNAQIGTTGQPYVAGAWIGDYWLFTTPAQYLEAGTIVHISFLTRSSGSGLKYFVLEYFAGEQWHVVGELMEAAEDSSIEYTHAMTDANQLVSSKFVMPDTITEDNMYIRFRIVGTVQVNGTVQVQPSGGTHRIAADTTNEIWATISLIDPNDEPEVVKFTLSGVGQDNSIIIGGDAIERTFTVTADWDWTLKTEALSWATVTPTKGDMGATVTVKINAEKNTGSGRLGKIILTSGDTSVEVRVFQSAAGGSVEEEIQGLPVTNDFSSYGTSRTDFDACLSAWRSSAHILYFEDGVANITYNKGSVDGVPNPEPDSGLNQVADPNASGPYYFSGSQPVLLWASMNDYWLVTVPVSNAPAGQKVKISGNFRSSAKGVRHYSFDYSTDGINWSPMVDPVTETLTVGGSPVTVTYSDGFDITTTDNNNPSFEKTVTMPDAVASGNYYFRFTIASKVAQDLTRENGTNTGGTTRVIKNWTIEAVD